MNLIQRIMTSCPAYKQGKSLKPEIITIHSTAAAQPNPDVYTNAWNSPQGLAAPHFIIYKDGIYQLLPLNMRGWHVGGKGNDIAIGIEICEPAGHFYTKEQPGVMQGYDPVKQQSYFDAIYAQVVELCVFLCREFTLKPGAIHDHAEMYALGLGSNHADVGHWFPKHGKSVETVRQDVAKAFLPPAPKPPEPSPEPQPEPVVLDNTPDDYAASAVRIATSSGFLKGNDKGDLMLHSPVIRQDLFVILERMGII